MKTLSDINRDELRELLENIRESRQKDSLDENGEPARVWTNEDIDRLLGFESKTGDTSPKKNDGSVYTAEESFELYEEDASAQTAVKTVDISENTVQIPSERIKSIMDDEAQPKQRKSIDFNKTVKSFSDKASGFAQSLLSKGKQLVESLKSDAQEEEKRFLLDDEDFEDEDFEISQESHESEDVKIDELDMNETEEAFEDDADKTRLVELDELDDAETEEADTEKTVIIEEIGEKEVTPADDFENMLRQAEENGQMTMPGFADEVTDEKPEKIEESEAEKELFRRRKAKIDSFVLFGDDSENDPYGTDSEKERLGDLFDTHEERPRRKPEPEFIGVEYSHIKDARRVRRYLGLQKKKLFRRVVIQAVLLALAVIVSAVSASQTTVAGDRALTIFSNLALITLSVVASNQMIANTFEQLKKKIFNINTAVSFSAILAFIQTLLMLVLYLFRKNTVSVFGGVGVAMLFLSELTAYITYCRTADALELCTGANKDKLYGIEGISDDKDAAELGKNVKSPSPRIRYSAKTRFPSHLIELCTGETRTDKNMRFIFLIIAVMSLINLAVAWAVSRIFAVGFAAFTITFSMCVPAYAALLVQLPLRWVNKKFNKVGGMISCQSAVNELCRTNAIILDSRDLFDQNMCSMSGFKDFKNVRVDDVMLYAAAMVIRSGGPLTGVFDRVVANRRDILPTVKSFNYEEKLGVSGWINNQKVILGNKLMMINHNIDVPENLEEKYLLEGHEVMYLAVAHKLAMMMVFDYAPNKKLAPYLKKLRDSGVTVLVRNCDPNVTDAMLSECYNMRLDNIKILNSSAGRVFKKYKSRPKVNSRAIAIHDGTTYTFMRSLCTADMLRHVFKMSDIMMLAGIVMGFAIVLILSILNVVVDLPAIFAVLLQLLVAAAFTGAARLICSK